MYGQTGILWDTLTHHSFHDKKGFSLCFFFIFVLYFLWGGCEGKGQEQRDKEAGRIRVHDVKLTKNQ